MSRSAVRKASYAADAASGGRAGRDAQPTVLDTPEHGWDAQRVREQARTISAALDGDEQARTELIAQYGSVEQAVTSVGNEVRARAESLVNINLDTWREDADRVRAAIRERLATLEAERAALPNVMELALRRKEAADSGDEARIAAAAADTAKAKDARERLDFQINGQHTLLVNTPMQVSDLYGRLSNGYRRALAEVRDLNGDDLTWQADSDPVAVREFNAASRYFPADWCATARAMEHPTHADVTTGRAHYSPTAHTASVRRRVQVSSDEGYMGASDFERVVANPRPSDEYERVRDEGDGLLVVRHRRYDLTDEHGHTPDPDGPAPGPEWERVDTPDGGVWRRPRTVELSETVRTGQILTMYREPRIERSSGYLPTSIHELSHSFEHHVPQIGQVEGAFYRRRTAGEALEPILPGRNDELARADHFPLAYSGKDYAQQRAQARLHSDDDEAEHGEHYELLSTGTEALFAGRHGGYIGGEGYLRDDDSRAFVLGVLTCVGRRDH